MGIFNEDSLLVIFSECPIPTFEGAPTCILLNILNSHLNVCVTLVHSDLGNSTLVFIVLISPPATYNRLSTLPFVVPVNVGPTIMIPDTATMEIDILGIVFNHIETLRSWQEYTNVDRAINRVIKSIVPKVYF